MPNYVTNILTITGKDEDVEEVLRSIEGKEECITFQNIVPMPEELNNTRSPAPDVALAILKKCDNDRSKVAKYLKENVDTLLGERTETTMALIAFAKCGWTNWYDWSTTHWGTKWDASSQSKSDDGVITFDTAWSTPVQVMTALSKKFPKVVIRVEYADEDLGSNCGYYEIENGEFIEDVQLGGDDGLKFACDIKGCNYEEVVAERNQDSA
jgi:hypothetical protein